MCQPSATSAIEWKKYPATISTSIIVAVSATTLRVRFSADEVSPAKLWLCFHAERSVVCIGDRRDRKVSAGAETKAIEFASDVVIDSLRACGLAVFRRDAENDQRDANSVRHRRCGKKNGPK